MYMRIIKMKKSLLAVLTKFGPKLCSIGIDFINLYNIYAIYNAVALLSRIHSKTYGCQDFYSLAMPGI